VTTPNSGEGCLPHNSRDCCH